jgi:phosphatidate cytidylyltransferase
VLRARLLTAAVLLPLLIWLLCRAPQWLFSTVLLLCTVLGLHEYFTLIKTRLSFAPLWGVSWGIAVAAAFIWLQPVVTGAMLVAGLFGVFTLALRDNQPTRGLTSVSESLFGVIYAGFLIPHIALLRQEPDGVGWVFFVFLVAMLGDTAGYAVGRTWGTHKLIPHISPGKTIEGSLGSVGGNLLGAGCAWFWFLSHRQVEELLCLGIISGVLAQIGDLCESAIKRAFGAKDSGQLLPGHGGLLDRFDSLLFPAAFIYYYGKIWG